MLSKTLNFDSRYLKFGAVHEKKEQKQFKSYLVSEKAYKILAWKPYYTLKKGFEKIALKVGETKTVNFVISEKDLMFADFTNKMISESGSFTIKINELTTLFNFSK